MLLSIYLTDMQEDGHRHLINEKGDRYYTRVADLDHLNKNRFLPDVTGNHKKAHGEKSHEIMLTDDDLRRIKRYVEQTPLLKSLAKEIHDVFNGFLADEINAVSMQRQGRLIATVKNYFPLKADSDDPNKKFEVKFEGEGIFTDERLKSRSFTKQRIKSWTAIVIDDALSVFQRHVNETAEYCGMTIPIENIQKVLAMDNGEITMRRELELKFGGDALHYLNKLLGDIQKRKETIDENWFTKATGHAMGAALAFNPRSALKNWAAMPLANVYFGTGNVAKATVMGFVKGESLVEKYNAYTPYMWYRAQGNGTVVGELSRQHGLYGRAMEKLDIMSWADQKVVNSLLYAAEQHVKQTTDLEFDSEEFKKEVARQFEKCVEESQPNSMITSKPQFVRNDVMRVLSLNAFASQRMAMGNGVIDSFMEYSTRRHEYRLYKTAGRKQAMKAAKKKFVRKLFGVFESGLLQSLLGVLASAVVFHKWDDYKDEKGEVTWESLGQGLGQNVLKGLPEEILGGFVWLDKLYGAAEKLIDSDAYGADFSVMSLGAVTDIADAVKNGKWEKAWGKFADMMGIPAAFGTNFQRLWQSGSSYAQDIVNLAQHGVWFSTGNKGTFDLSHIDVQIAKAYEAGDGETAEWLRMIWADSGKTEKAMHDKLAQALADENDDVYQAAVDEANGKLTAHKAVKDRYVSAGLDGAVFDSAVTKVINGVKKDVKEQAFQSVDDAAAYVMTAGFDESAARKIAESVLSEKEKTEKSAYSYADAVSAWRSGNIESYEMAREELISTKIANGKNREEAEKLVDRELKKQMR